MTDKISSIVLTGRVPRTWWIGFAFSFGLVMLLFFLHRQRVGCGHGHLVIQVPVGWGFAIINFVWWKWLSMT